MAIQCPVCGKEAKYEHKCIDCWLKDNPEVVEIPRKVKVEVCRLCSKVKQNGKWVKKDIEDVLKAFVKSSRKINEVRVSWDDEKAFFRINIELEPGLCADIERTARISIERKLCPLCYRQKSHAFRSILQLRGKRSKIEIEANNILETMIEDIAMIKEKKEGIDIYFIEKNEARSAADRISKKENVETKKSHKLVGLEKGGKRRHRETICLRFI